MTALSTAGIVPAWRGSIPLDWPELLAHARRPWLPDWRGEIVSHRPDVAPISGPVAIAACSLLAKPQAYRSQADAETFRVAAKHAQNAMMAWRDARYAREVCRQEVLNMKDLKRRYGMPAEAAKRHAAFLYPRGPWVKYRRSMRLMADQVEAVRCALTPRPAANAA